MEVWLDQKHYIEKMSELEEGEKQGTAASDGGISNTMAERVKAMVRCLMWVACATTMNIAAEVALLANSQPQTQITVRKANKCVRYLKATSEKGLVFRRLQEPLAVMAFGDAAFQNLPNAESSRVALPFP
jgi:hypothetical protein